MKFIVKGSVRGIVSKRRTLSGAVRSLRRDQEGCRRQGGYSDARIYDAHGTPVPWDEIDAQRK
jgi:hypothetical protein